jgi:hypothetical protein
MFQNFTYYTAVATANYKNLLRIGVAGEGKMCNHLLVPVPHSFSLSIYYQRENEHSRKFIPLRALDNTIQHKYVPIRLGFEDQDILVLGLFNV